MLISKNANKCDDKDIKNLEERFGFNLSLQYLNFIKKYNGGYTPKTEIRIGRISTDIRAFIGFGSPEYSFSDLDIEEWIDRKLVPIAVDSFGNYFAMNNEGNVCFCDHEAGFSSKIVSDDFLKFIKSAKSGMISERAKRTVEEREADLISKGRGHVITESLRQTWKEEYEKYVNMIQEEVKID